MITITLNTTYVNIQVLHLEQHLNWILTTLWPVPSFCCSILKVWSRLATPKIWLKSYSGKIQAWGLSSTSKKLSTVCLVSQVLHPAGHLSLQKPLQGWRHPESLLEHGLVHRGQSNNSSHCLVQELCSQTAYKGCIAPTSTFTHTMTTSLLAVVWLGTWGDNHTYHYREPHRCGYKVGESQKKPYMICAAFLFTRQTVITMQGMSQWP